MRRRLREVRHARDGRLLELGALVFELHRRERRDSKLLEQGVARVAALDVEERALAAALGTLAELPALGPAAGCPQCAALLPAGARFCAQCGTRTATDAPALEPAARTAPNASAPRSELARPDASAPQSELARPEASAPQSERARPEPAAGAAGRESQPVERETRFTAKPEDRQANMAAER